MARRSILRFIRIRGDQKGMSLPLVVLMLGVVGIAGAAMMRLSSNYMNSEMHLEKVTDRESVERFIFAEMDCKRTLAPYCPGSNCSNVVPTCPGTSPPSIDVKNERNINIVATAGQRFGQWVVRANCIANQGVKFRIASIKTSAPVNTTNPADFILDPLTKKPLDWTHPNADMLPLPNLSCTEVFNPAGIGYWCPAPAVVNAGSNCPTNYYQIGYSAAKGEVCCSHLIDSAFLGSENQNYYARWNPTASNRLQRSSITEDAAQRVGFGLASSPSNRLVIKNNVYVDSRTAGAAITVLEGNKVAPGDSNAASLELRNVANSTWWHISHRGGGTRNLEIHTRASYGGLEMYKYIFTPAGKLTSFSNNSCSDVRLKDQIHSLGGDLIKKLHLIDGVSFQFKKGFADGDSGQRHFGVIAQQVEPLFPELIGDAGEGYKSVNYGGFAPILIEAVKTLDLRAKKFHELEKQVAFLQHKVEERKKLLTALQAKVEKL